MAKRCEYCTLAKPLVIGDSDEYGGVIFMLAYIDYMDLINAIKLYEERVAELKISIKGHDTDPFFDDVRHTEAFIAHVNGLREDLTNNENLLRWLKELKERRSKEKGKENAS